jgi:16S rRNA (cytosine1402-N4)-methyltransferase
VSAQPHVTVLLHEARDALFPVSASREGVFVDGTFGRGGHSRAILAALGPAGRLLAIDRDPAAIEAAQAIADSRFCIAYGAFATIDSILAANGVGLVDGVLLDIGVSSPQLDQAERGFSFSKDGPLDMRMDTGTGETAADWLARVDERELAFVIGEYGEERFAQQIARALVAARSRESIRTTGQLAQIVAEAVRTREPGQHPATRTFQAIRIHLNQELAQLEVALPRAFASLKPGGRLVVISFHSLEDRIVKHTMRGLATADTLPRGLPIRASEIAAAPGRLIGKPIRASQAEIDANPRARSAIMRVIERVGGLA